MILYIELIYVVEIVAGDAEGFCEGLQLFD
jgi:hypothetical protein